MGDKIQIPRAERKSSAAIEGAANTRLSDTRNDDNRGACVQRPCTYADIVSAGISAEQNSAILKRTVVKADTRRISGTEEAILGATFVG